jgi:hypothetical protein
MNIPNPVLSMADVFTFGEQIGMLKWPPGITIAIVRNKGMQADYKFAENVVVNRFPITLKMFDEVCGAERWLINEGSNA